MKLIIALLLISVASASYAQQKMPTENDHLYSASMTIAQRVCPAHPKSTVWLFLDDKWGLYLCGPVNTFLKKHPVDDYFKNAMDYQHSIQTLSDHVDKALKATSK